MFRKKPKKSQKKREKTQKKFFAGLEHLILLRHSKAIVRKTADKVADMGKTIVDGAVSGIDAIFYTDEEKAVAKQKASDTVLKF